MRPASRLPILAMAVLQVAVAFSPLYSPPRSPTRFYVRSAESMGGGVRLRMRGEDTQGKDAARAATERWIDEWVVGLKLCPWAGASSRAPQMRLLVVDRNFDGGAVETEAQMEAHVAFVEEEAQSLQALGGAHEAGSPETTGEAGPAGASHTTVLVFPGEGYEGDGEGSCGAFPRLARRCEEVARRYGQELLAFHPNRADTGPGCSDAASDAAHYSVRSPYPTLQLLRQADLVRAREQWAAGEEGRRAVEAGLPGALGLLMANKRRLREMGSEELQTKLRDLRHEGGARDTGA
ncbi:hypothetical protein T484DRAFT_1977315 [Baffinella frigidus]|nr:hypothetical protein T484DRAFT_1977315 [Cryptophyta sp. CCMP2293]